MSGERLSLSGTSAPWSYHCQRVHGRKCQWGYGHLIGSRGGPEARARLCPKSFTNNKGEAVLDQGIQLTGLKEGERRFSPPAHCGPIRTKVSAPNQAVYCVRGELSLPRFGRSFCQKPSGY